MHRALERWAACGPASCPDSQAIFTASSFCIYAAHGSDLDSRLVLLATGLGTLQSCFRQIIYLGLHEHQE